MVRMMVMMHERNPSGVCRVNRIGGGVAVTVANANGGVVVSTAAGPIWVHVEEGLCGNPVRRIVDGVLQVLLQNLLLQSLVMLTQHGVMLLFGRGERPRRAMSIRHHARLRHGKTGELFPLGVSRFTLHAHTELPQQLIYNLL